MIQENEYDGDGESLPSRERGLKSYSAGLFAALFIVAPLAGAWIEIGKDTKEIVEELRRSPRGSVD